MFATLDRINQKMVIGAMFHMESINHLVGCSDTPIIPTAIAVEGHELHVHFKTPSISREMRKKVCKPDTPAMIKDLLLNPETTVFCWSLSNTKLSNAELSKEDQPKG